MVYVHSCIRGCFTYELIGTFRSQQYENVADEEIPDNPHQMKTLESRGGHEATAPGYLHFEPSRSPLHRITPGYVNSSNILDNLPHCKALRCISVHTSESAAMFLVTSLIICTYNKVIRHRQSRWLDIRNRFSLTNITALIDLGFA